MTGTPERLRAHRDRPRKVHPPPIPLFGFKSKRRYLYRTLLEHSVSEIVRFVAVFLRQAIEDMFRVVNRRPVLR